MSREGEQFFAAYSVVQVEAARRAARRAVWGAAGALLLVVIALAGAFWAVTLRPAAVVEYCGISEMPASAPLPRPQVLLFLEQFVDRYSAQRPDAATAIAEAYGMMTPRLQQVLLAERADAGRAEKWMNQNIRSDFVREKARIAEGEEGRLTVEMLGKFIFRPAVGFDGDHRPYEGAALYAYLHAALLSVPVTAATPYGLLVDFYQIRFFDDAGMRDAFLLKRHIVFPEGSDE